MTYLKKIIFSICFFALFSLRGQSDSDSLVFFHELNFHSEFEKKYFEQFSNYSQGAFELIMTIGNDLSAEEIFTQKNLLDQYIESIQSIPIKKKKSKYYQEIFDRTHATLLQKYELENYYYQVFENGRYNCVSACAVYAMIFDELGIDYALKETPTHVYLILDPETEQFIVETTDPQNGLTKFSPGFKGTFVQDLAKSKWIDQQEFENNTTEILFEKYYFNESKLGMREIVALQYSNHAIYESRKGNYKEALNAYQKSYFLYPEDKTRKALFYVLMEYVAETGYSEGQQLDVLGHMSRFDEAEVDNGFIINEFKKLTEEVFIDQGNIGLYQSYYEESMKTIGNEKIKDEIHFIYNHERGRILHNRGYYDEALSFLTNALTVKPSNADVEMVLITILEQLVIEEKDDWKIRGVLVELKGDFPTLEHNNHFGGFYLNSCLTLMEKSYRIEDRSAGESYKEEFESLYSLHPRYRINENLVGDAYGQAAVYHFKRGEYNSAKQKLRKGLQFDPDNNELIDRWRMVSQ